MQFKDIKEGYAVYLFDKKDFKVTEHKVLSVTYPHFDMNIKMPNQMVIDMGLEGFDKPFVVPDTASITYAGDLVIAINKEDLTNEVNAMVEQAKRHISMNAYMQKIIDSAPGILSDLSPAYKERAQTEERFTKIEKSVNDMKGMLENFIKEFKS